MKYNKNYFILSDCYFIVQLNNTDYSQAIQIIEDMYSCGNFEDIPKFKAIQTDDEQKNKKIEHRSIV